MLHVSPFLFLLPIECDETVEAFKALDHSSGVQIRRGAEIIPHAHTWSMKAHIHNTCTCTMGYSWFGSASNCLQLGQGQKYSDPITIYPQENTVSHITPQAGLIQNEPPRSREDFIYKSMV